MKRKIIQIAKSTVMVSIPSKWAKKYNLTKGEEIEIKESGPKLVIETKKPENFSKIFVDATSVRDRVLRHMLAAVHKAGYTEIEIKYNSKENLETINDLVKNLYTGFAIMEQRNNKLKIKKISKELEDEFDPSLRRAILVTISLSESVLDYARSNNYSSMHELINLEKTNNQLTNFCERLLNEGIYDYIKTTFLYTILWNLEKIADEYKYICIILSDTNIKISKETLIMMEDINKLLNLYYELFYNYENDKLNNIERLKKELENKYTKALKNKDVIECKVLNHLINVVSKCSDFNTNIVGLNIIKSS